MMDIWLDVVVLAALDGLFFCKQIAWHDVCVMQAFWHTEIHRDLARGKHVDYLHHTVHAHLTQLLHNYTFAFFNDMGSFFFS